MALGLAALGAAAQRLPPPSVPIKSSAGPSAGTFDPSFSLRMLDNDVSEFVAVFAKHQHTHTSSRAALQSVEVDIWPDMGEEIGQGVVDLFTLGQGRRAGAVVRRQRTVLFLGFTAGGEVTNSGLTGYPCGFQLSFPKPATPPCQPVARH
jgi:hypothetical protein